MVSNYLLELSRPQQQELQSFADYDSGPTLGWIECR
jgi:hypothetical protein